MKHFSAYVREQKGNILRVAQKIWPHLVLPSVIVLTLLLLITTEGYYPNFLSISTYSAASTFFSTVASIVASVLGIVIAFLLLALELLRRTFRPEVITHFLDTRLLSNLVWLNVSIILISLYSLSGLPAEGSISDFHLSLVGYVFWMFLVDIIAFINASWSLLTGPHPSSLVRSIVRSIDKSSITSFLYGHIHRGSQDPEQVSQNPIHILQEAIPRYIATGDTGSAEYIGFSMTRKLVVLLSEVDDTRETIRAFLPIFQAGINQAIEVKNETVVNPTYSCPPSYKVINGSEGRFRSVGVAEWASTGEFGQTSP